MKEITKPAFLLPRNVEEIMTREVVTIGPEKSAIQASKLMREKGVGSLIVVKNNEIVGILTERDIVVKVIAGEKNPAETRVETFMTSPVITCSPKISILDAARMMSENRIRRLPVVEEGRLVGIVTAYDIALYGWGIPSH